MKSKVYLINSRIAPREGKLHIRNITKEELLQNLEAFRSAGTEILNYCNPRHEDLIKHVSELLKEAGIGEITPQANFWEGDGIAVAITPKNQKRTGEELHGVEYEYWMLFYSK